MFLKSRNILTWIFGILAALLFSVRLVITETGAFQNSETAATTTFETSIVVEMTKMTTFQEIPITTEMTVFYKDTNFTGNHGSLQDYKEGNGRRMTIPSVLLASGLVLAILFIFVTRQECRYLGPEAELFLLSFCVIWIRQFMKRDMVPIFYLICLWILFFFLLVFVRCLWTWIRKGFPFEWSIEYRLGRLFVGSSGKQSRYLLFQFTVSILMLIGCICFLFFMQSFFYWWMFGADCLIIGGMAISHFIRLAYDIDHLSEQIRYLHQGDKICVRAGAFAEDEEKLVDFYRHRDEAIDTAVTSERFKVELISNVSHDLRTPLTVILGYGELLKSENLSLDGKKQLEELNRKTDYMRNLVDSLFELTKVSSGVLKSKKEQIDLIRLLEQTMGLFEDQLNENGLFIRRHYEMESMQLVTDGSRIHQVFANLIENAIKYSPKGTRIHLEVKDEEQDVRIRITNIASYEMNFDAAEILQRFVRGDQARTTKGSGLGLAIAQTYTESVGGTFEVQIDAEQFCAIVKLPKTSEKEERD